jgi:uncharacterized repeat protein (TIGR01451 family)
LEDRILLDSGLPAAIVVGRTLSSYTTAGVQNNQETITYTVYNEQADPETGVLLTDTLEPGVTFQSASQLPDQSGQQLAWSLRTIQGFDRASVSLTVTLSDPIPLQLDAGAQAFATLDAGAVSNTTPAATLRQGSVDPSLLASTPDANTTDPFIQEAAAKLNYDPQQIFNFLHNDIGYNSYLGSLRGARGTLWSSAGNALDVASLGVALMRASGIPAQYVSGTLSQSEARQLILSMFPISYQTVGYISAGTPTANPANDPQLLAETESHYWFQFDTGNGMQDADPPMPGAVIAQSFTTATATFAEVPDSLREKVEVALKVEISSPAESLFEFQPQTTTVLDKAFNTVDTYGKSLSVGNFVDGSMIGSLFSTVTYTYTPYLVVNQNDGEIADAPIIRGTSYQEVLTSLPLSSRVVTGLFLEMTCESPEVNGVRQTQTYERTIVDRIGYAVRHSERTSPVAPAAELQPALTDFDIVTIDVTPGDELTSSFTADRADLVNVTEALQAATPVANSSDPSISGPAQAQADSITRQIIYESTSLLAAGFVIDSGQLSRTLAKGLLVCGYVDTPRLILASSSVSAGSSTDQTVTELDIDVVSDPRRSLAFPGEADSLGPGYRAIVGMTDGIIEDQVLQQIAAATGAQTRSSYETFVAAVNDGIPLVSLDRSNLSMLDQLSLSTEAKARITNSVLDGNIVVVPREMVSVLGKQAAAWFEINPVSGTTSAVSGNGLHAVGAEETAQVGLFANFLAGLTAAGRLLLYAQARATGFGIAIATFVKAAFTNESFRELGDELFQIFLREINSAGVAMQFRFPAAAGFRTGIDLAIKAAKALFQNSDPPADGYLGGVAAGAELGTPGSGPITSLALPSNRDPNLTSPVGGVQGSAAGSAVAISDVTGATWQSATVSSFLASSLNAGGALVVDADGRTVGSGVVNLVATRAVPLIVGGDDRYSVVGVGTLSFYGPAEPSLGLSADWASYSSSVTGNVSIMLTTDGLALNGTALPAGGYTITTSLATLVGSGASTSPNFAGSASVTATRGTVKLGPGSGNVTVGRNPLDLTSGGTLTGYSGNVIVAAGGGKNTDEVTLSGNAADVLSVSAAPDTLTTDQNTPVTFHANVNTSLADTYNLTTQAPPGWTVAIDSKGNIAATPAPGLQNGTYPIQVVAQSTTNADLVAQTIVNVSITPPPPGMTLAVNPDPIFSVPFDGAQLPTAYQAVILDTGPAADTYNVNFTNLPAGWTILNSGTSVTVPAGLTGILGVYLQPSGNSLPPPGTPISFTVTATSTSDATITATRTVSFAMPVVDAVTVVSSQTSLGVAPGTTASFTVTLQNVGNVPENVNPTTTLPTGMTTPDAGFGLFTVSLAVGQYVTEPVHLHADSSLTLNSTLTATVTASYGPAASPVTQAIQIPVAIVVPGVSALVSAAATAGQLGETDLADRLSDLVPSLTNLVQDPTNAVFKSRALADLDSLIGQIGDDPFLSANTFNLPQARSTLAAASTAAATQTAVSALGGDLIFLSETIAGEAAYGFRLALAPNTAVAQPQSPADYDVVLQNTGTKPATYDFKVSGLPSGITATFSQPSITLQPGQAIGGGPNGVTLALTETGNTLVATGFSVTVTAEQATGIGQSVPGTLTVRDNFVSVVGVNASPAFIAPGSGPVDITASVLDAVNEQQQALASYTVTDPTGNVVHTSPPVPLTLTVQTSLANADLGSFATTGLAPGSYTINVTVTDPSGNPLPGGTGQGSVLLGTPVTASLSVSATALPPGTNTVTNTLQLTSQTSFPPPLTLLGQVQTTPTSTTVALDGNLAYAAGTNGIDIVDISNPTSPRLLSTFGQDQIVQGGLTVVRLAGNELIVGTTIEYIVGAPLPGFKLLIYSLADPLNPTLVSQTHVDYSFPSELLVQGSTVLVPTYAASYFAGVLTDQSGSLLSLDVSNPASPVLNDVLYNDQGTPYGGHTNQNGGAIVNDHVAYIASSTSTGSNSQSGIGRVLVVDYSDPATLSVLGEVDIPGTVQVVDVAIQGNRALVVGSTGGWRSEVDNIAQAGLTGNLTLSVLDISNPLAPQVVGTTQVTDSTLQPVSSIPKISALPLGNGLFAVSEGLINGKPMLLVVDPTDPSNIAVTATPVPSLVNEMAVSNGLLYTTSAAGLGIYQIGSVGGDPVTVSVQVPNNTGVSVVPGSFNFPPTQIIQRTSYNTLVWDRTLAFGESQPTFTWQTQVTNLRPGDVVPVTGTTTIDFVDQGTPGTLTLPPAVVSGEHLIGLTPATRTVQPGETATYDITLQNTTAQLHDYSLQIKGVPLSWVTLPAGIMSAPGNGFLALQPNSSVDVKLQLTSNASAVLGSYGFTVITIADATGLPLGAKDTAQGTLTLAGQPVIQPYLQAHGVVATLTPAQATAGQGTSATYTVRLINTGSADDTFSLAATLPAGVTGTFAQDTVDVPPGVSNFRDVTLTLTPQAGTTAAADSFSVMATSTTDPSVTATTSGTLTVLDNGVSVALNPPSGAPGSPFQLTVTNTGQTTDTFDLALGGPAALVSSLGVGKVALAPGASQTVPVSTSAVTFADAGALPLLGMATSESEPAVQAGASAALTIPGTTGMTTELDPPVQALAVPGTTSFLLLVHNTGNTEDRYTATITGTDGPVSASLQGLDGTPTQTIPVFRLPGLSTGAILLNADLAGFGQGNVTIQVQSLNSGALAAEVVATVTAPTPAPTPKPTPAPPPVPLVVLTGVTVNRTGRRDIPTSLLLQFSGALDAAVAADPQHYHVYTGARPRPHKRRQPLVNVLGVSYDPARQTVLLRVGKVKNRKTLGLLDVQGLIDSLGRPFDGDRNGQLGGSADVPVNLRFRRKHP